MYIVLVYDICFEQNGTRVLNKVFKICKKYLCHIQNSVFEGELSEAQLVGLTCELRSVLRADLDSVIIFKSRHERWLDKEIIGIQVESTSRFI